MRPGQQNKRSRGRGNGGGRKNVNPLSRSYESNGPDVKVRGNPATIAEKYVQLARDAQASGDSVMAENYFQHAEHYFRIISAAQAQSQARQEERERERVERAVQSDGATNDSVVENTADESEKTETEVAKSTADTPEIEKSDETEAPKRTRRTPRPRRPRRTKAEENALAAAEASETQDAPASNVDLSQAEQPKLQVAEEKPDDSQPTEAAE